MNKALRLRIVEQFGTQADFAQAISVDESKVSRVIRGRKNLKPKDLQKWSEALRCDPSILECAE
jgi:transcriptional regulator with XRE-family HTH domain